MVGPGGFLRACEDLRDAREERHEPFQFPGCGAVESRRVGAERRRSSWANSIRESDEQVFPRKRAGAVVCILAEGKRRSALQEGAYIRDRIEQMGGLRRVAACERR